MISLQAQSETLSNYGFSMDTVEYRSLDMDYPSLVSVDSFDAGTSVLVDIGFPFTFAGETFTQLVMRPQAEITLGTPQQFPDKAWVIAGFSTNLMDKSENGSGVDSKLRYVQSGEPGNRILKLEWHRLGFYWGQPTDEIQMQIWLHESTNKVSIHYGEFVIADSLAIFDISSGPPVAGLLQIDWNSEEATGFYLTGDGNEPDIFLQTGTLEFQHLENQPNANTVYEFCPNGACTNATTSIEDLKPELTLQMGPNPARDFVTMQLELQERGPIVFEVVSLNGQVSQHVERVVNLPGMLKQTLPISHLTAGMYLVRIQWQGYTYHQKLMIQN